MARYKNKNDRSESYEYNGLTIWINKYKSENNGLYFAELNYRDPSSGKVISELETKTSGYTAEELEKNIDKKALPKIAKKIIKKDNSIHKMDLPVYSYWILNKDDIAVKRAWGRDKMKHHSKIMDKVGPELGHEPMSEKTIKDYIQAVGSAASKYSLSENDKKTSFKLFELLWYYSSVRGGCSGDNPITVYLEGKKTKKEYAPIVKDHFRPGAINRIEQKKIMEIIESHINDDGQYLGVALMFMAGLSANEACAIDFKNLHNDNGITSLLIQRQYVKRKGQKKAHFEDLDSVNAIRAIPTADVLMTLINKRRQIMGINKKNNSKPLVSFRNQINSRATPDKLNILAKEILVAAGQKERIINNPNNNHNDIYIGVEDDIFRSNFQFVLWQGGMESDEINYLSGRAVHDTVFKHYVDFFNPQTQIVLKKAIDDWANEIDKDDY